MLTGVKVDRNCQEIMLKEYFWKIIKCFSMLCRTIGNDEEILNVLERRNESQSH